MSNPKVFEFAKEIGMTPLALMDKIREWQIPVKSHMAELAPDVLAQIKSKLGGNEKPSEEAKPKKVAARKAPAKKVVAKEPEENAAVTAVKAPVIRRKKEEPAPVKAKIVSRPAADEVDEASDEVIASSAKTTRVVVKKMAEKEEAAEAAPKAEVEKTKVVSSAVKAEAAETKEDAPVARKESVVKEAVVEAKAEAPAAPEPVMPARKKEVVVGTSGVSSSNPAPRRNIIGRMDLSRVQPQAPPRREGGGYGGQRDSQGGDRPYQPREPRGPNQNFTPRSGGASAPATGGGGFNRPAGGFNRPAGGTANRGIRPGFVAQMAPIPDPVADHDSRRDFNKIKKTSTPASNNPAAKQGNEREEPVQVFNAVEFRKREMVFQPKKKKGMLERESKKTQITTPSAHKRVVKVNNTMKLSDLAMEMGLKAPQLIKELMKNGVMANLNMELDFDTIALIVPEFGWEAQNVFKTAEEVAEETAFGDLAAEQIIRPPVVTVMGHVDHGKTSLLDAIRNADVAKGEAGGITQHIGAYSVKLEDNSLVTFLDTPGHEAFTAMRARGANATDIAVIVVAADDGMMPQTQEAINHAKAAGVPIIVAVNKIDKPGANAEKIKQQLTELEIVPEEWGGSTIFCEVSALKKTGIKELLEQIKLLAELGDLKANPKRSGTGLVIEAKMEKGKGPVATLLVKDGSVAIGQYIVAGTMKGRVRSLTNDRGERVESAGPGIPVEVLGLEAVPGAGDKFDIVKDEATAEKVSSLRKEQVEKAASAPAAKLSLDEVFAKVKMGDVKELAIVLKSDVHGSLEAINGMLAKLSTPEVKAKVIHSAVGGINEGDITLAHTAKGVVIGFNVRPDLGAQAKAKQMGVDVRTYSIVYELIDQMKAAMGGLLSPDVIEEVLGRAEVRNVFNVPKVGAIAGCFVIDGKVQRNAMIRLLRENKIVYEGKISSLKRFKDDAKEVASGYECGIGIENYNDVKVGDQMEAYLKKEVARDLDSGAR